MEKSRPTYIPGDLIEYRLEFTCKANVRTVTARFRNQDTGGEVVLAGEAYLRDSPPQGTRIQKALLQYQADQSEPPTPGRYRLAYLEATTHGGQPLDFDNPVEGEGFYFAEEPTDDLPKILYDRSGFRLKEGHPDLTRRS